MNGSVWNTHIGGVRSSFGRAVVSAVVLFAMGGAIGAYGLWCLAKMHRAASWPTAPGRILESRIQTSRGSKGRTDYKCKVLYEFSVGGRTLQGDALDPLEMSNSSSEAERNLSLYPPGGACTVHYDAADPRNSCLQVGDTPTVVTLFLVFAVAMLVGSAWSAFRAVAPGGCC